MDISQIVAIFQDLPGHLALWTQSMGPWIYVLLFAVIFAETGLIVTPFLPGDSLLFAIGALTALEGGLNLALCLALLIVAAILGDAVNYVFGRWFGEKLYTNSGSKVFNPEHLRKTHAFYAKHGGKTIILARFVPIVRTYAPFVAGMGRMPYGKFASYNVIGAIAWIVLFIVGGNVFGNIESVKRNFHIVILAILVLSVLPIALEFVKARRGQTARKGL